MVLFNLLSTRLTLHVGHDESPLVTGTAFCIFDRQLRLVSEGYLEKLPVIDATQSGQLVTNKDTGHRELIHTLTAMTNLDIKRAMGQDKKIRVQ